MIANLPGSRPSARKYLTWTPDERRRGSLEPFEQRRLRSGFTGSPCPGARRRRSPRDRKRRRTCPPLFLRMAAGWLFFDGRMAPRTRSGQFRNRAERRSCWSRVRFPITSFAWKPDSRTIVYGGGAMSTGELRQVRVDGHHALAPFVLEGPSDQITIAPNGGAAGVRPPKSGCQHLALAAGPQRAGRIRVLPKSCSPRFARRWIRRTRRTGSSSRSSPIVPDTGTCGWETRMARGLREFEAQTLLPFHPAWSPRQPRNRVRFRGSRQR